ncbi:MAG: DUF4258 domain-containing protein [Thermodesulfovibrionales bacterium]|nr:DUF4258 domain-containing protein [Thermodesulfovibrionales bacterium]
MLKLSRHVRNNMRLYGIQMDEPLEAINSPDIIEAESDKIVVIKRFRGRFSGYPLKAVYKRQGDNTFAITVYPLKKKYRR